MTSNTSMHTIGCKAPWQLWGRPQAACRTLQISSSSPSYSVSCAIGQTCGKASMAPLNVRCVFSRASICAHTPLALCQALRRLPWLKTLLEPVMLLQADATGRLGEHCQLLCYHSHCSRVLWQSHTAIPIPERAHP